MKKFIHIIHSDFSRSMNKGHAWFEYRLKILKNFTIRSLLNQTNKDFYYVIYLRKCFPEDLLSELKKILEESKLKYAIIYYDKENDIKKQITAKFPEAEYIYATRIDSDDLFHKDVVNEIQQYEFEWRKALIYQSGYYYDCVNKRMRHHSTNSPPFFTIMYPYGIYLNLEDSLNYKAATGGHDLIAKNMNSIFLSNNKYIVLFHERNDQSKYTEIRTEDAFSVILQEKHNEILKDFGITDKVYEEKILK